MISCSKQDRCPQDDLPCYVKYLHADMDYDDMVDYFGEPPVLLNAENADHEGLHIYQYPLPDSTFVRIGFTDRLVYACHVDERNNIVEDIIVLEPRTE